MTPDVKGALFNTSIDGSVYTLYEGALTPDTTYSLEVRISNSIGGNTSTGVNYLNFTTGRPPTKGALFVTPASGTMFETNFVIVMNNWVSMVGGDLRVNVWGVTQLDPK